MSAPFDPPGDKRGCPPGQGTIVPAHGGRIGNPPYIPTDEMRANVRAWIKVTDAGTIAAYMGISRDCLDSHYAKELREGRFELVANLGGKAVKMALGGDRTMLIFVLRTQGKWNTRVELTGPGGGPIMTLDLSKYTDEQLALIEPILAQLAADGGIDLAGLDSGGVAPSAGGEGQP